MDEVYRQDARFGASRETGVVPGGVLGVDASGRTIPTYAGVRFQEVAYTTTVSGEIRFLGAGGTKEVHFYSSSGVRIAFGQGKRPTATFGLYVPPAVWVVIPVYGMECLSVVAGSFAGGAAAAGTLQIVEYV